MVSAHVWTDGTCEGDGPHSTPQPSIYTPFWCPPHSGKGVSCGKAISKAWETAAGVEASGLTPLDSWGGGLDMVVVGAWWCLLGGGGAEDMDDCDTAPLRSPNKSSASDPATANCNFCSPLFSSHCTSSSVHWPSLVMQSLEKKERRDLSQRPGLAIR